MPFIDFLVATLCDDPLVIPFLWDAVLIENSGLLTGNSPLATRKSVFLAMSACFICNFESSIAGKRICNASTHKRKAVSFSSSGILEWSASSEFSPLTAISARMRAIMFDITSNAMSISGDRNDCAFKISS